MELVLIPPFRYLAQIANQKFHLILPHLLEDPQYAEYVERTSENPSSTVILDNSLAEYKQIEPVALIVIGSYYGVDELVVPDVMGDSRGSVEAAEDFVKVLDGQQDDHPYSGKLAFVAQGRTVEETLTCARTYLGSPILGRHVSTIMIPRRLVTTEQPHARLLVAEQLHKWHRVNIHLLGASSLWPREIRYAATECPFIRSMDTSMPFVFAMQGFSVETRQTPSHREGDMDYWSWMAEGDSEDFLLRYNIATMQSWASGK